MSQAEGIGILPALGFAGLSALAITPLPLRFRHVDRDPATLPKRSRAAQEVPANLIFHRRYRNRLNKVAPAAPGLRPSPISRVAAAIMPWGQFFVV
jgi:hypothetical protein